MPTVKLKGLVTIDLDRIVKDNNITELTDPIQWELVKEKIFEAVCMNLKN